MRHFQLNFKRSKMYHLETSCLRNCYKSNQIVVSDLDRKKILGIKMSDLNMFKKALVTQNVTSTMSFHF